jgi:hypothetical protein
MENQQKSQVLEQTKKPIWKKWWVWVIAAFIFIMIVGSSAESPEIKEVKELTEETKETIEKKLEVQESILEPELTIGERNALKKAKSYLDFSALSYNGLIKQLEYEGFTRQQAEYGAANSGADWNEQAARKAKSYLDFSAFSKDGLITQLEYEGFTRQQAEYGARAAGY